MNSQFSQAITYEDAILETLTLPEEVKVWGKRNPKFLEALKVVASNRFLHLGSIIHYPKDKVLGMYSYDYQIENPKFKQDFIEYSDVTNPTFTLYTAYIRKNGGASKWVKDIKEFFKKFKGYGNGVGSHHLSIEELLSIKGLPPLFKERAEWAIKKGIELKESGIRKLSEAELVEWMNQVKKQKQNDNWYIYSPIED